MATLYEVNVKTLMKWIREQDNLVKKLRKLGYKPENKLFTIPMVREIFNSNLGWPELD